MRELRVHGVGGPQEERLLGVDSPQALEVSALGRGTRIVRRAGADDEVEGYSWGGMTSSSRNTTPWLIFVPFSLINAAGWACPSVRKLTDGDSRWVGWHDFLVKALGFAVTAAYTAWILELLVDLVGWQWRQRLLLVGAVDERPWLSGAVEYGMPAASWALALGLLVVMATFLTNRSQPDIEEDQGTWGQAARFTTRGFYRHSAREQSHRYWHFATAGLVVVLAAVLAFVRRGDQQLFLGDLVVAAAVVQGPCLMLLWVLNLAAKRRPVAAAAATLGAILANATFGGLAVLAVRYLSTFPGELSALTPGADEPLVSAGPELGQLATWLWTMVASVTVLVVTVFHVGSRRRRTVPAEPPPPGDITEPVRMTESLAGKVQSAERLARLAHRGLTPFCLFAGTLAAGGLAYWFVLWAKPAHPWSRDLAYRPDVWTESAMAFVLVALPAGVGYLLRRSAQSSSGRRRLGVAWDVLLIWPRRFHPLAITPYAEQATREIRDRLSHHLGEQDGPVILSAHSQGSALAYIALCRLRGEGYRRRVHFITYGSHLNGLYALAFPRYFNAMYVEQMRGRLASWQNFWRSTDPIGGPVFSPVPFQGSWVPEDEDGADRRLADPARTPPKGRDPASKRAPRERDRAPYLDIAGHSHYLAERDLKMYVRHIKKRGSPPPSP